jgi:hypothetical protein
MIPWAEFKTYTLDKKVKALYERGTFVMAIRYYRYKINLYMLGNYYLEVFVNHKQASIEKIALLDPAHTRMKFYSDQIKLPTGILAKAS